MLFDKNGKVLNEGDKVWFYVPLTKKDIISVRHEPDPYGDGYEVVVKVKGPAKLISFAGILKRDRNNRLYLKYPHNFVADEIEPDTGFFTEDTNPKHIPDTIVFKDNKICLSLTKIN